MKLTFLTFLVVVTASCAHVDRADNRMAGRDIAAYAHEVVNTLGSAPGVSIAVVRGDHPIYVETFGLATSDPSQKANNRTLFYLASSTKPFTGLMIESLGRKGIIDIDAPISSWLPQSELPPEIAASASLRDLVSLRARVDNDPLTFRSAFKGDLTPELRQKLLSQTERLPEVPKGSFQYSNGGFNIATALLERKLGLTWQQLVEREVLRPAGMRSTTPWPSRAARNGRVLSAGHFALSGPPRQAELQKGDEMMQSAGGLYTTSPDLARWLSLQLSDGKVGAKRYFPAGLIASTHQPRVRVDAKFGDYQRDSYGMGWYIGSKDGVPLVHAFGSFVGNWSHVSFRPTTNTGVAVLVNEEAFGGQVAALISDFAYDRLEGKRNLATIYSQRLQQTKLQVEKAREAIAAEERKRAIRPWQLTRPRTAYTGDYHNGSYGGMSVCLEGEELVLHFGRLRAVAEAYPRPDTVRIEFTPGQGRLVEFRTGDQGEVTGLDYSEIRFVRQ